MSIFDFTLPGTEAQALYIEDALRAFEAVGYGEPQSKLNARFPWMPIFDAEMLGRGLLLGDIRITHDTARMEIRISPGEDEDDMDHDPRNLDMSHDAVAAALLGMKWAYAITTPTTFTYFDSKIGKGPIAGMGGTISVSRKQILMETFAETEKRLEAALAT